MIDDAICIRMLKEAYATNDHVLTSKMQEIISKEIGGDDIYRTHVKHITGLFLAKAVDDYSMGDRFAPLEITSKGVMHLQGPDSLASQVSAVSIQIRPETIADLASIINSANIPQDQKDKLFMELGKHGAKDLITKGIDYAVTNPKVLIKLLLAGFGIAS